MKRAFIIVLDSLGIGALPDSKEFSDNDCNTLKTISKSKEFCVSNFLKLGLGNIDGIDFLEGTKTPKAAVARMTEKSKGKDTTIGHWEIAGLVSNKALPTFPYGFSDQIIKEFSEKTGRGVLCNSVYSGTEAIKDFGQEHLKTGDLIVYASADSVFQIAAHESLVPVDMLYRYCKIAREILKGENAVGRVIARPFVGETPNFTRTQNRKDFSLKPPKQTLLDYMKKEGKSVIAVGKISDIFADKGVTEKISSHSNSEGMEITQNLTQRDFEGLCFVNLVDFDMLYGHRQDVDGYAKALSRVDMWLPQFISKLKGDDLVFITADHGCDPGDNSTDHTREYTPLLVLGEKVSPVNLRTRQSFSDIAATIAEYFDINYDLDGQSFLKDIIS